MALVAETGPGFSDLVKREGDKLVTRETFVFEGDAGDVFKLGEVVSRGSARNTGKKYTVADGFAGVCIDSYTIPAGATTVRGVVIARGEAVLADRQIVTPELTDEQLDALYDDMAALGVVARRTA